MNPHKIGAILAKGIWWVWSRRLEATVKVGARRAHRVADEIDWPPDETTTSGSFRLDRDHKGEKIPVTDETAFSRYAYKVDCPTCGMAAGKHCVELTHRGHAGQEVRSPHQSRANRARSLRPGSGQDA